MGGSVPEKKDLPKTHVSFFEIQDFLNKWNLWLYENAKSSIPVYEGSLGYLRLPTEHEWEFAARGGSAVAPEVFDKQIPYPNIEVLARNEWLIGSDASSRQLKPVARSGGANPLGLFDLFGNASELTSSHFSVEPNSGRVGGFVVKGGDVGTLPREARSAMRTEFTLYSSKGVPNTSGLVGFRPIIGSNILTSIATASGIANARNAETGNARIPMTILGSEIESNSGATSEELEKTKERLKTLEGQIQELSQSSEQLEAIQTQLLLTRKSLDTAQQLIEKKNREVAVRSVRLASRYVTEFKVRTDKLAIDPSGFSDAEKAAFAELVPKWRVELDFTWEAYLQELTNLSDITQSYKKGLNSEDYVALALRNLRQEIPDGKTFAAQRAHLGVIEEMVSEYRKGLNIEQKAIYDRLKKAELRHGIQ
jgi:DNA-binding FrmR family transcriptional regulator